MSASTIAKALGGHGTGTSWMARCPAHDDKTPSLAIREGRDGRPLLKCHAGCTQGDVIGALKERGIWKPSGGSRNVGNVASNGCSPVEDWRERAGFAIKIWKESTGATGSPVETYLRSRGLTIPSSPILRFHPALKHPAGITWPAMVALVTDATDAAVGVHRTFLARDGSGKAPVSPARMALGPIRGGSVRLAPAATRIVVGEGIESVLSVTQNTSVPGWAALSTSGLRTLVLPRVVEEVVILADADPPGEAAARDAAERWTRDGRRVRIARPTPGFNDFNDMLKDRMSVRRIA